MKELDYLIELNKKYNRYLYKYFKFRLRDIAERLGIPEARFSKIVKGKVGLPEDLKEKFVEVFKELDIEGRTKDFKESDEQKWRRSYWNSKRSQYNEK